MGSASRRRKGQGGLFIIRGQAWNEVRQTYEEVDFYRATRDVENPDDPTKRKQITGTGRSQKEAQDRLIRSLERFYKKKGLSEAGVDQKSRRNGSLTLSEHFEEWHSELRPEQVSLTLRIKYKQHFNNHILPHVGNFYLEDLNYKVLQKLFYETLPAKRRVKGGVELDEPLLSSNALLNIYSTLNVCLSVAVKMQRMPVNPLGLVDTPKYVPPKENIAQIGHLVEYMFKKMAEANDPLHDHFLLALLGLRKAERLGLTFSALILTGSSPKMTIKSQLQRVTGQGLILKPATKTGKDRTVALIDPWLSCLKRMKAVRKQQMKLSEFKPDPEFADLVFLKDNGKPYDLNEDNELWNSVVAKYGKRGVRIRQHSLRHVSGTRLADANVSREIAMAILGHESESMSFYYGRMTQRGQVEQLGKFGEAMSEKIKPRAKD
jgi:site-specific recombinase XerD